jgi:hypothetical protein
MKKVLAVLAVSLISAGCLTSEGPSFTMQGTIKAIGPDVEHDGTEILFDNGFGIIAPVQELPAFVGEYLQIDGTKAVVSPTVPEPREVQLD